MSSVHPWDVEDTSLPWNLLIFISGNGQYIGLGAEGESAKFDVPQRNAPLPPGNTPRSRSEDEELDVILPAQPVDTIYSDDFWDPIATAKSLDPLLCRVQGFPTRAIHFEGYATIGD